MNSDVFIGTMGSVAEPEQGLGVSSFPASSTRTQTPGNISHSSVPSLFYHHAHDECKHIPVALRGENPPFPQSLLPAKETSGSFLGSGEKRIEVSPLTVLPDFNWAPIFHAGFLPWAGCVLFCICQKKKFHDSISTSPLNEF